MIWWTTTGRPRPEEPAADPAQTVRLVVVGDVMLDSDVLGAVTRICPDAPAPVLEVSSRHDRPGGAGLAALMAARDGVTVTLLTATREDTVGHRLSALLRRAGVRVEAVAASDATRRLTRVRARTTGDGAASLVRVDDPGGHALPASERVGLAERVLADADAVLVADYGGGVTSLPSVRAALAGAAARGLPVVWDPHPRGASPVPGVALVTPNRAEAAAVLGAAAAALDPDVAAVDLRSRWDVAAVAVTDGSRGVFAAAGGVPSFTPAPFAAPGDTCGAGDRFAGTVALGLARGAGLVEALGEAVADVASWIAGGGVGALVLAPAPAAASAPSAGASADVGAEVTPFTTSAPPSDADPLAEALAVAERVRAAGGRVVATGGCFDVLHAGHVASLEAARRLGDCLVVIINSDDSVRRLKGASRPVNSAADRARVLAGLAAVDAVGVFAEDDPCAALARLRPDVWAKGGDYAEADLPETRLVQEWGGRAVLLPFLPGRSTTRILAAGSVAREPAVTDLTALADSPDATPVPAVSARGA
ncbi:MAG: PfkB family carbohydrate kinase [Kineosporiaceae bacterium]